MVPERSERVFGRTMIANELTEGICTLSAQKQQMLIPALRSDTENERGTGDGVSIVQASQSVVPCFPRYSKLISTNSANFDVIVIYGLCDQ